LEELLAELRLKTPEEIKKYQRMISNRDAILNEAKERAEAMLNEAKAQTSELVSEHEIMQQAYIQANDIVQQATEHAQEILDHATQDANNIRMGAMQYTDESLANLQNIIAHSIENFNSRYDVMIQSLTQSLDIFTANRNELNPQEPESEEAPAQTAEAPNENYEDYTVPINLDDEK
jgi:cell division septum initiation protein DivIVA